MERENNPVKNESIILEGSIISKLIGIKFLNDMTFMSECAICLVPYKPDDMIIPLPCDHRHYFHADCISNIITKELATKKYALCPLCQTNIKDKMQSDSFSNYRESTLTKRLLET